MTDVLEKKTSLDSVSRILDNLREHGYEPELTPESYDGIVSTGIRTKNLPLAFVATQIALEEKPLTLRGLMYRVVSAGCLPSTDKEHYSRLGRLMTVLREAGVVPFSWIVDNVRSTEKPSSWSGLVDFADAVKTSYRKNLWSRMPEYVHVIAEKDAIAGVLSPVTRNYDVSLSPIRGYVSLSFAHEIAEQWNQIEKPIHAYYLGDFDASGFDLERDVREKLRRYCKRPFEWTRLAVNLDDFDAFGLIPLKPKKTDTRYRRFVDEHGGDCAELDAIPATELRKRVQEAIEGHIDQEKWASMKVVEKVEKETINTIASNWKLS